MHGRQFEYLLFDRNMMNIFNLKNFLILSYFILFYFISLTCLIMDKSFKFKNFVQFAISSFFEKSILELEATVEILGTVTYDFSFLCKAR